MPPPLRVSLDPAEQAELEHRYRTTRDAETRTRYQMVLLAAQGHTPPQIAMLVRRSPDTIRRVLKRYLAQGPDAVPHRPHLGQPPHYPPAWQAELVRVPDATLAEDLVPEDLPRLLGLLGRADLYLQDEVEVALHPTLTRVWSRAGRSGQRRVQAPGNNAKQYGFGLVDWRDGHLDWALAEGRRAAPLVAQLRRAADRSRQRGRIAMVILDNLGIHTPKGSRLLRGLLEEVGEDLVLVYTPTYDPDANRIEWLWRALRRTVTHTHQRQRLDDLVADADRWAHTITPAQVLSQIGSPFAPDQQPAGMEELNHAA